MQTRYSDLCSRLWSRRQRWSTKHCNRRGANQKDKSSSGCCCCNIPVSGNTHGTAQGCQTMCQKDTSSNFFLHFNDCGREAESIRCWQVKKKFSKKVLSKKFISPMIQFLKFEHVSISPFISKLAHKQTFKIDKVTQLWSCGKFGELFPRWQKSHLTFFCQTFPCLVYTTHRIGATHKRVPKRVPLHFFFTHCLATLAVYQPPCCQHPKPNITRYWLSIRGKD